MRIAAALLVCLSGCASTVSGTNEPVSSGHPVVSTVSSLPGFRKAGTELIHEASGMHFPARVGNGVRAAPEAGDIRNDYVIVRYGMPNGVGGRAIIRIAIVQLNMKAEEHYAIMKPVVLSAIPDGLISKEGPYHIRGAIGEGYRGSYVGPNVAGDLITANFGEWSARLETEYSAAQIEPSQEAVRKFVSGLDWSSLQIP